MGKKWRWGVILDAGSSGTRLHIYRWKDPEKALKNASKKEHGSLPRLVTEKKWTKKIRPGVSEFGDKPSRVGPEHLQSLIDHALKIIPEDKIKDTPIFLMATAGCAYFLIHTGLPDEPNLSLFPGKYRLSLLDCGLHIQVIPGETEGLYGWIASNYLLGGFDKPDSHQHGKGHHTYGFLDMGGASAQIAFAPNSTEAEKHSNDLKLLRMRTIDGSASEYKVFTATWLGFGVNQARESYVQSLRELYTPSAENELPDPCMPKGLRTTLDGDQVGGHRTDVLTLLGTGAFDECLKLTHPLLGKDKPCRDQPCLLNGQHVPAIDFDVNHFIGVSEYWHTTHGVFGGEGDKAYDFKTYQQRVKDFCSRDWDSIVPKLDTRKKVDAKIAQEACFKASWLINVLHDGIGIPRIGIEKLPAANVSKALSNTPKQQGFLDPFQPVDKIGDIEVSWTLGKMVLYAAGQIPPKSGDDRYPVGFGSNAAETIPSDFQFAGSSWHPHGHVNETHDGDDDWDLEAEDLLDKAKSRSASGLLIFFLLFVVLLYFFRTRERRMRLYGKVNALFFHRPRRPGSPRKGGGGRGLSIITNKLFRRPSAMYERVMEEGDADHFELGDVDSSSSSDGGDNDHSDSSEGSGFGRTSGLATPKVNLTEFEPTPSGSALDRSGLVVRTDSRDRLLPSSLQMLHAGKRSRAGSPTRQKSPLISPLQQD